MSKRLTGAYQTADGRLFPRERRDEARQHDAWIELRQWCEVAVAAVFKEESVVRQVAHDLAYFIAERPDVPSGILKRKPRCAD